MENAKTTTETLDLTGLHPNVRQSIELDFAANYMGAKRTVLAFLGKTPGVEVELTEIINDPNTKYDRLAIRRAAKQLETLSQVFPEYGWELELRKGHKGSARATYCKTSITREEFVKRECPLFEDLSKIPRTTQAPTETLRKAIKKVATREVALRTPVTVEQRLTRLAILLALDETEMAVVRKVVEGSKRKSQGISTKYIRAELDISGEDFDSKITQILIKRMTNRFQETGIGIVSAKNGYLAPFFSTFEPSSEITEATEPEPSPGNSAKKKPPKIPQRRKTTKEKLNEANRRIAELEALLETTREVRETFRKKVSRKEKQLAGLAKEIEHLEQGGALEALRERLEEEKQRTHRYKMQAIRRASRIEVLEQRLADADAGAVTNETTNPELERQLEEAKKTIAQLEAAVKEGRSAIQTQDTTASNKKDVAKLERDLAKARAERKTYSGQARYRKKRIGELERRIEELKRQNTAPKEQENATTINNLRSALGYARDAARSKDREIQDLQREVQRLTTENQDLISARTEAADDNTENAKNLARIAELEAQLEASKTARGVQRERVNALLRETESMPLLRTEIKRAQEEKDRALAALRELLEEQGDLTEESRELQRQNSILRNMLRALINEIQDKDEKQPFLKRLFEKFNTATDTFIDLAIYGKKKD